MTAARDHVAIEWWLQRGLVVLMAAGDGHVPFLHQAAAGAKQFAMHVAHPPAGLCPVVGRNLDGGARRMEFAAGAGGERLSRSMADKR